MHEILMKISNALSVPSDNKIFESEKRMNKNISAVILLFHSLQHYRISDVGKKKKKTIIL